jgi:guanylate kinase
MIGHLYVIAAPSGAGKTTLTRLLLKNDPSLRLSISTTTRAPRPGEAEGRDYNFVSTEDFKEMAARGDFLEWAEVHGNHYATSRRWIENEMAAGHDVLLEIDWQGAQQVRAIFPQAVGIFVLPPSLAILEARLSARGTDSAATVARRIAAARDEMRHVVEFDYVIINSDLEQALRELTAVVTATRLRYASQRERSAALFETLL